MSYPKEYLEVYRLLKKYWKSPAALKVGFTVNHAYVMGYINREGGIPVLPQTPMAPLDGGFGKVMPFEQWPNYAEAKANIPAIKALLAASDFMGVSNYARCVAVVVSERF